MTASASTWPGSKWQLAIDLFGRTEKWTRLRHAALRTAYYASEYPQLRDLTDVRPVGPPEVFRRFEQFQNRGAGKPRPQALGVPWRPSGNSVALAPWFHVEGARVLPAFSPDELTRMHPDGLAAPVETLRALASLILSGKHRLPALRFGVIAFAGVNWRLPDEEDRDALWKAFQVPLFVQVRGFHGELLAAECEAQDGFHVNEEGAVFEASEHGLLVTSLSNLRYPVLRLISGFEGRIENRVCLCGMRTPRLAGLRRAYKKCG